MGEEGTGRDGREGEVDETKGSSMRDDEGSRVIGNHLSKVESFESKYFV